MTRARTQQKIQHQSELYRIVFSSVYVKGAIALLLLAFLVQPVAPVFANEETAPAAESAASVPAEVVEEPEASVEVVGEESSKDELQETLVAPDPVEEEAVIVQSGVTTEDTTPHQSPSEAVNVIDGLGTETTTSPAIANSIVSSVPEAQEPQETSSSTDGVTGDVSGGSSSENDVATTTEDTASSTGETTITPAEPVNELSTTTEDVVEMEESDPEESVTSPVEKPDSVNERDDLSETENMSASTSTEKTGEEVVSAYAINNENRYQFGQSECVSVGDGAFYCSKDTGNVSTENDGVYAALDSDGDREIFLRAGGIATQITHNRLEDAAPSYDESTDDIVFHRLIEGRYQIIRYDLTTGTEEQLTDTRENNTEPTQRDGVLVWQRWVEDNWDIAMKSDGETKIISVSKNHDVAPTVRDGYVLWHTTSKDGDRLLSVYEIASGVASTIADPDGGHVENPRFVLVYDTKYENGDVVTKQYDPKTGEILPITAVPAPLPVEIPESDSTGETRALIQSKTSNTKDEIVEAQPSPETSTPPVTASSSTSSVHNGSDSADLVVRDATRATSSQDTASSSEQALSLSEFDIIVEPFASTSSAHQVDSTSTTSSVE